MARALAEAEAAAARGEVPVGAVLIDAAGRVVAAAGNRVEADHDPFAHAEMLALRAGTTFLGAKGLGECDLWVTLEPCAMCAAAIGLTRLRRLYFAALDAKGGAVEHGPRLFERPAANHRPEIYGGIDERRAADLLRDFFRDRRPPRRTGSEIRVKQLLTFSGYWFCRVAKWRAVAGSGQSCYARWTRTRWGSDDRWVDRDSPCRPAFCGILGRRQLLPGHRRRHRRRPADSHRDPDIAAGLRHPAARASLCRTADRARRRGRGLARRRGRCRGDGARGHDRGAGQPGARLSHQGRAAAGDLRHPPFGPAHRRLCRPDEPAPADWR